MLAFSGRSIPYVEIYLTPYYIECYIGVSTFIGNTSILRPTKGRGQHA